MAGPDPAIQQARVRAPMNLSSVQLLRFAGIPEQALNPVNLQ
jgi:hypothetical protein